MQYKAGYFSKKIFDALFDITNDEVDNHEKNEVNNHDIIRRKYWNIGLIERAVTFDVSSNLQLTNPDNPKDIPSLLAVANNIITRGFPTLLPRNMSEHFDEYYSKYNFSSDDIFWALHLADKRKKIPSIYLNDIESDFERNFISDLFNNRENQIIVQYLQHQRPLRTLSNDQDAIGRVDFCIEIPYYIHDNVNNRHIKKRTAFVIEIDGKKYHRKEIDDIRDYEIGLRGNHVMRIREAEEFKNITECINFLRRTEFYNQINRHAYDRDSEKIKLLQTYVLAPLAIARIHKMINQFLIANFKRFKDNNRDLKIAIIERDVPCGIFAVRTLNELYFNLQHLENKNSFIPKIKSDVFYDSFFYDEYLTKDYLDENNNYFEFSGNLNNPEKYDLIIDISMLWRSKIFSTDNDFKDLENSIIIRSSHYTEHDCIDHVYCANPIEYRDLTKEIGNEQHEELQDALPFIEYFLQNIFYKDKFRKGQLPILNRALKNKSVIGLLPTGGGKSLTYQIASMLQPGVTIVIDPIRSLMIDQNYGLKKIGINRTDFVNSILDTHERKYVQENLLSKGKLQFVFCSPERLVIEEFRTILNQMEVNKVYFNYCVIDEAHCVSEWGHDFRTPYLSLGENAQKFCKTITGKPIPLFGLTATASFDVLADIERELQIQNNDGNAIVRYENTVRNELFYRIIPISLDTNTYDNYALNKKEKTKEIIQYKNDYLNLYNTDVCIRKSLNTSYESYIPINERNNYDKHTYIEENLKGIKLNEKHICPRMENHEYNYGIIVFCPHRTHHMGVINYQNHIKTELKNETVVMFIGSDNDESINEREHLEKMMHNQNEFIKNRASVMVATKAFGMGIDKSNVRITIHINPASSIESFVQESGRAGRDGKLSLSVILYCDQLINDRNRMINKDEDILMYFYKNAFKGADKERTVLWELRNKIFYPRLTNREIFEIRLRTMFHEFDISVEIDKNNYLIVKKKDKILCLIDFTRNEIEQNKVNINGNTHYYENILKEYQNFLGKENPIEFFSNENEQEEIDGIEKELNHLTDYESKWIGIPFQNKFYYFLNNNEKRDIRNINIDSIINWFLGAENINNQSFNKVKKYITYFISADNNLLRNKLIKDEIDKTWFFRILINHLLGDETNNYESFMQQVFKYSTLNDNEKQNLLNNEKLKMAFYIPRGREDTAKAIYRLKCLGIIDDYLIDYRNKVFYVKIQKKDDNYYYEKLREIINRYTTDAIAIRHRDNCIEDKNNNQNATAISTSLKHLTNFVYNRIADKRKRAIDDMIDLCRNFMNENDHFEQSEKIKEYIYYYFNAKYSREGNIAIINNITINADLNKDFKENLAIFEMIKKYIEIVEKDDNGNIINNLKHLRGATMKMLRAYNNVPQINILKAFSLCLISNNYQSNEFRQLQEEAKKELLTGIQLWKDLDKTFDYSEFITYFSQKIYEHIATESKYVFESFFNDIDDIFYLDDITQWLKNFNNKFLYNYSSNQIKNNNYAIN